MRLSLTSSLIAAVLFATPAAAQQWIQIQSCGGALPAGINPSAATIAVNPSGQLCVLTGAISVTVPTPPAGVFPQPASVVITSQAGVVTGAYVNGALVTLGDIGEAAYSTIGTSGDVIALLKGIFANVITPVAVTGSFAVSSPLGVNIAATTPINVTVPSPLNVTGNLSVASPLGVNIASSPVNVTLATVSPQNVTVGNQPTVVLSGSPVSVGLAGPSPISVTVATIAASPLNTTISNSPTVVLSGSPVSVGLAGPTPLNVTVGGIVSPQNMTLVASPLNVTATSASPVAENLVQLQGVNLASASTYGVAPVGSVQGVNAFITSLPASPLGVQLLTGGGASPPVVATPLNMTLVAVPGSPISVVQGVTPFTVSVITTPIGVNIASSPVNVTIGQTPLNMTLAGPTPLNVTVGGIVSPQNVTLAGPTPLNVTVNAVPGSPQSMVMATPLSAFLSLPIPANVVAHTVTTSFSVTAAVVGLGATPGIVGVHQLAAAYCQTRTPVVTPPVFFLQLFSGSTTEVVLGTTRPRMLVAIAGSPVTIGALPPLPPPGAAFTAISFAVAQGPTNTIATGAFVDCTFAYN